MSELLDHEVLSCVTARRVFAEGGLVYVLGAFISTEDGLDEFGIYLEMRSRVLHSYEMRLELEREHSGAFEFVDQQTQRIIPPRNLHQLAIRWDGLEPLKRGNYTLNVWIDGVLALSRVLYFVAT